MFRRLLLLLLTLAAVEGMKDMDEVPAVDLNPDEPGQFFYTTLVSSPIPYFRYTLWDNVSAAIQAIAMQMGYDKDSWNGPNFLGLESIAFLDLDEADRAKAMAMGFEEDSWDCYVNNFDG